MLFFSLNTGILGLILCGIVFGATLLGLWIGRRLRKRGDTLREPLGVLQGSILGVVGLVLAFGLALAVGRYEARRAVVVDDANAIGTAYLRAQTLPEPIRSSSLQLLTSYTDAEIALSDHVPGSDDSVAAVAVGADLQRQLWTLAGQALQADPNGNASRLYVESLNEVINLQTLHVAALSNRVPGTVLLLEVLGAAAALWPARRLPGDPRAWGAPGTARCRAGGHGAVRDLRSGPPDQGADPGRARSPDRPARFHGSAAGGDGTQLIGDGDAVRT